MHTYDVCGGHASGTSAVQDGAERRERILEVLEDAPIPIDARTLALALVDRDAPERIATAGVDAVSDVETHLHHVDLPKLDAQGEIEYDASRRHVR